MDSDIGRDLRRGLLDVPPNDLIEFVFLEVRLLVELCESPLLRERLCTRSSSTSSVSPIKSMSVNTAFVVE